MYCQLTFDKDANIIHYGKENFQQMVLGKSEICVEITLTLILPHAIHKN